MTHDVEEQANSRNETETQEQEEELPLSSEVTEKCIRITERYCSGIVTKVSAILELQGTIPPDDESTYLQALGAYVRVLDNFKRIRERASTGRNTGDVADSGEPVQGGGHNEDKHEDIPGGNKQR
jgi:hypothetical protein